MQEEKVNKMFWCNVFFSKKDVVVAICDEELLGKKLKVEGKKLTIEVSEKFYGGKLVNEEVALKLLEKATIGNLIGKRCVELAEKNGFIIKENVILINGIPHAQFVKL
ncbi:MAG: DUF424 family protein [Candidatus Aenigmatarchaeota archaeon]